MSVANRASALPLALLLSACGGASDENVAILNEVPADADVEVLPADESAATPSDELENGATDPNVNAAD